MKKLFILLFILQSLSLTAQETKLHPVQIHDAGASTNEVLTWDGTEWIPQGIPAGSDDQQISLSGNTLTLEDGGTVDLSPYLDNIDAQTLSYNSTTGEVTISNGNTITISIQELWVTEFLIVSTAGQSISISGTLDVNDGGVTVTRNGLVQRLDGAEVKNSVNSLDFMERDLEVGEIITVKYPIQ